MQLEFGGESFAKAPRTGNRRRRKVFDNVCIARGLGSPGSFIVCSFFLRRLEPRRAGAMAGDNDAPTNVCASREKAASTH